MTSVEGGAPSRRVLTNLQAEDALSAAVELSKIGSKKTEARQWVASLILWLRSALASFYIKRDMIIAEWAERDETTGEIVVQVSADKTIHRARMRNEIEAQMAQNTLQRESAQGEGEPPAPITWDNLDNWFVSQKGTPAASSDLAARLGPFITIP